MQTVPLCHLSFYLKRSHPFRDSSDDRIICIRLVLLSIIISSGQNTKNHHVKAPRRKRIQGETGELQGSVPSPSASRRHAQSTRNTGQCSAGKWPPHWLNVSRVLAGCCRAHTWGETPGGRVETVTGRLNRDSPHPPPGVHRQGEPARCFKGP